MNKTASTIDTLSRDFPFGISLSLSLFLLPSVFPCQKEKEKRGEKTLHRFVIFSSSEKGCTPRHFPELEDVRILLIDHRVYHSMEEE